MAVLAWGCSSSSSTVDRNGGSTGPICGDADGDGYCINIGGSQKDVDCDDSDAERHPGAAEVCNSKDDDCDGTIDNDVTAACQLTCAEPEGGCETLTQDDVAKFFARVPFVSVWGDNSVGAWGVNGDKRRGGCVQAVNLLNGGGGKGTFLLLPEAGIPGNSHMMMMDKNNLQIAGLLRKWIGENVR